MGRRPGPEQRDGHAVTLLQPHRAFLPQKGVTDTVFPLRVFQAPCGKTPHPAPWRGRVGVADEIGHDERSAAVCLPTIDKPRRQTL